MIINNSCDLHNGLKYLIPSANLTVWETQDLSQYHGETRPITRFKMFVDWRCDKECPSEVDINNIDQSTIDNYYDSIRKQQRDNEAKQNTSIMASYQMMLQLNPNLTLTQYLDGIEALQKVT